MTTLTWDYVAGYFDGEGSAGVYDGGRVWQLTFSNTHLESLEQIQAFIGAGNMKAMPRPPNLTVYSLVVVRVEDLRRIIPELQARCLVKQTQLATLLNHVRDKQGQNTVRLDVPTVTALYWNEGLTMRMIADRLGVTSGGVSTYMLRHGIPRRSRSYRYRDPLLLDDGSTLK